MNPEYIEKLTGGKRTGQALIKEGWFSFTLTNYHKRIPQKSTYIPWQHFLHSEAFKGKELEMLKWCKEHMGDHAFDNWFVTFHYMGGNSCWHIYNEDDAIMFKMRWG